MGSVSLLLATQVLLLFLPEGAIGLVILGTLAEAAALSVLNPLTSTIQMLNTEREQRARISGWLYALCLAVTSPTGVIAGVLSDINRVYPFYLNTALLIVTLVISLKLSRINEREAQA